MAPSPRPFGGTLTRLVPLAVPYVTVGIGLWLLHNAWAAMLGYHAGMLAVLLLARQPTPLGQVFRSRNRKVTLFAALPGACAGPLLLLVWPALSIPVDVNAYVASIGLTGRAWPYFLGYFMIVNPLLEECYWRGYLGSNLKRPVLNDFIFAGYHVMALAGRVAAVWLIVIFLALVLGAWLWRQSDRLAQGLLPSIASHAAADIGVMLVIYRLVAG